MSNAAPPGKTPTAPPRELQSLPGLLSFLVPGLGQIYQGRISKGVVFLVSIYGLFFYGMWLGSGTVRASDPAHPGDPPKTYTVSGSVYLPVASTKNATFQGMANDLYNRPQYLGQFCVGVVAWPALFQYWTYDAKMANPLLGQFERTPTDEDLNVVYTYDDKAAGPGASVFSVKPMDLGWVYTVIAGVLNILVIYDALAGPAFLPRKTDPPRKATA